MSTPPDHAARHRIATELDATLFVEAGAGSGKTTALVERVVALVASGTVDVERIAAITFTEASAAELRVRVRTKLETIARDAADPRAPRCRDALSRLDEATISTLHSFAQQILTRFPIEVGIPPRVEIADEMASQLDGVERMSRIRDALLDDPALEEINALALAVGLGPDAWEPVVRALNQNWDLLGAELPTQPWPPNIDLAPIIEPLAAAVSLAPACSDPDDALLRMLVEEVGPLLDRLRHAQTAEPATRAMLLGSLKLRPGKGNKQSWTVDGVNRKPEIVDLVKSAAGRAAALHAEVLAVITDTYLPRLVAAVIEDAQRRTSSGRLEFHDLLVLARRLLRTSPSAQRALHETWERLLVDEFQDTDPIQVELAVRVAADRAHPADTAWSEIPIPPGRLFFVGDPKQSIYKFRRADIEVFNQTARVAVDEVTRLTACFRTVPEVLAVVNDVFDTLFVGADGQPVAGQAAPQRLDAVRESLPAGSGPAVATLGKAHDDLRVGTIRHIEARDVAGVIERILADGWVVEGASGECRPARLDDICILIPSRTVLPGIEDALAERAIAYRIESGTLIHAAREIQELRVVLSAIEDPGDHIAVVGALRSEAYGCSDHELVRWRQAGGSWSVFGEAPAGLESSPVAAGLADLAARHDARVWEPIHTTVERVVRERGMYVTALAEDRPRDRWRRLRIVIEQARQFAEQRGASLHDFVRWAELAVSDTIRASAPVLPEADLEAVRIMTIHAAKGLEFPVCILAGLNVADARSQSGPRVIFDGEVPHVRMHRGADDPVFDALLTADEQMDLVERRRLLYVAMTRARDHLIVSLHHKKVKAGARCAAAHLEPLLDGRHDVVALPPAEPTEGAPRSAPRPEPSTIDAEEAVAQRQRRWVEALARRGAGVHPVLAATAVAAAAADAASPVSLDDDVVAGAGPEPSLGPGRAGRRGAAVGSATHAVLEAVDLGGTDDVEAMARLQARRHGVPDAAEGIARRVRCALDHELLASAAVHRHRREVHVATPLADGTVLEGIIDLLIDGPDGLVVVDFKTDAVTTEAQIATAVRRYRLQGATYALAVESATGRTVSRVVYCFVGEDATRIGDIDDLADAIAEVRSVVAELVAADASVGGAPVATGSP